ncbi:MAG: CPBP family intramembrane metalloprotease [Flavobacteriales bacterium]|nr:MAG: CPBP family intramembrane metalloprotease [Flavobacteriales bacterium]
MSKNLFFGLGLFTLIGFSLIGALIIKYGIGTSFGSVFQHGIAWYFQILIGLVYGFVGAWLGWKIIKSKLLIQTREFYRNILKDLELNIHEIIFISFCAGVGEEILFRGAIQYYLGIWLTAIIFVAIHGYLNPKNWKLSIYGAFMTVVIAGMGWMFEEIGLLSAISAHFAIDAYLLKKLTETKEENNNSLPFGKD